MRRFPAPFVLAALLIAAPAHTQGPAFQYQWGSAGTANGQFNSAHGIAVAPDGTVYVAG